MQAVIMAAGKSTRTYPLTLTRPKPLLPVLGKPILAHQIEGLRGLADELILVVNYRQDMIIHRFGTEYEGMPIRYVEQPEPRGTGHAVLQCADVVDGPFLVMNGDDLYDPRDLRRLAEGGPGALAKRVPDPRLYGIYEVRDDMTAVRLVEKPDEIFSDLAGVGAYKFPGHVFDVLRDTPASERGEIEITSAVQTLAEQAPFQVIEMNGYWLPIGYPWHLLSANEYFIEHFLTDQILGEVSSRAELNGKVYIGKDAVIRAGAVIDGPVYIGEGAVVGPNCWLRPGTTLGKGTRIGNACEVKNSIFMDGAAAPHLSYIGDSIVGEHSNIGAGTKTANLRHDHENIHVRVKDTSVDSGRMKLGAIIADNVHTAINTSIYPGRMLWPGTITFPGEAVRKDVTEIKRTPQK